MENVHVTPLLQSRLCARFNVQRGGKRKTISGRARSRVRAGPARCWSASLSRRKPSASRAAPP